MWYRLYNLVCAQPSKSGVVDALWHNYWEKKTKSQRSFGSQNSEIVDILHLVQLLVLSELHWNDIAVVLCDGILILMNNVIQKCLNILEIFL